MYRRWLIVERLSKWYHTWCFLTKHTESWAPYKTATLTGNLPERYHTYQWHLLCLWNWPIALPCNMSWIVWGKWQAKGSFYIASDFQVPESVILSHTPACNQSQPVASSWSPWWLLGLSVAGALVPAATTNAILSNVYICIYLILGLVCNMWNSSFQVVSNC